MSNDHAADPRLAAFPRALRELLDRELTAGNTIAEVASCFPAPPAGAYVKLSGPVTTRPHIGGDGLVFYDRNSSIYSGEWTDSKRFYFILEPPRPPPPEVDMDAIRDAMNARAAMPPGPSDSPEEPRRRSRTRSRGAREPAENFPLPAHLDRNSCVRRFEASMVIDYDKWREGIGYDLSILKEASAQELAMIENLLIGRRAADWRDVEALAAIGSKRAKRELRRAFGAGNAEIRAAVINHAPELVSNSSKTDHLVEALRTAEPYYGFSQATDEASDFHPPEVIAQLFRSALTRKGGVAVHCAALLLFIHGKAESKFDWNHRPFLLRFNTQDSAEREKVFRELCARIGQDPSVYLQRGPSSG